MTRATANDLFNVIESMFPESETLLNYVTAIDCSIRFNEAVEETVHYRFSPNAAKDVTKEMVKTFDLVEKTDLKKLLDEVDEQK